MPNDYEEVVIVVVVGMALFLVLTGIVIYILFFYQQKRFQHKQQIIEMREEFNETLLTSQIEIQEHNLNIISREIHDNVGQLLSLVKIQLNMIGQKEIVDQKIVNDARDNISRAVTDLRDIAKGLNSERIQVSNLYEVVQLETDRINRSGFITGSVLREGEEREVDEQKKLILFRIIQECLQNIMKHARARTFNITLKYTDVKLHVTITDDGAGFDVKEVTVRNGLGLSNIKSRTVLIGGTATIDSERGKGTFISIQVPYS